MKGLTEVCIESVLNKYLKGGGGGGAIYTLVARTILLLT